MKKAALFVFLFFALIGSMAQEFNYWNQQVGARSSMLSGAVTAGVNDNSAIYYNPSALGHIKNSNLSISSDGYYYHWLNIENGAGENMDLKSQGFNIVPQIVSFIQKVPGIPVSTTIAFMNRDYSSSKTAFRNEGFNDVIPENPGKEYYIGEYSYNQIMREDWLGFGYGKAYKKGISFGASAMFSFRNQIYNRYQYAQVYKYNNDTTNLILNGHSQFNEDIDIKNLGLIFLAGVSWKLDKVKLALNITFPRMNLRFFGRSDIRRSLLVKLPSQDTAYTYSIWHQKVKSTFNAPLIIDFGIEYKVTELTTLFGKISYFNRVKKYNVISLEEENQSNFTSSTPELEKFENMVMANRALFNFALAMETTLNDHLKLLFGTRTDFNYFDDSTIDKEIDPYSGITYWDLYHLSGGVLWHFGKVDLSLGSSFSFGRSSKERQQVNLSHPTEDYLLFGERDYSAKAKYNQLSVFFGFTYYIPDVRMQRGDND